MPSTRLQRAKPLAFRAPQMAAAQGAFYVAAGLWPIVGENRTARRLGQTTAALVAGWHRAR